MKTEWISVTDRLPKQGKSVLVVYKGYKSKREQSVGKFWKSKDGWLCTIHRVDGSYSADDSEITHWMPLPSPPQP